MQSCILEWLLAHLQLIVGNSGKVARNLRQHESFLQLGKKAKRSKDTAGEVGGGERGKAGQGGGVGCEREGGRHQ